MLDAFGFPGDRQGRADVQIFTRPCTVDALQWETWRKPRGVAMAHMIVIGGGAGGGGGFTAAAAAARGGGGGGGSSGMSRLTIPTILLPDILYVQVGAAGIGVGSGGGTAGSGVNSSVQIAPTNTQANRLIESGGVAAVGGTTGTGAAAGTGGAAGTVDSLSNSPLAGLGQYSFTAGQIGAAGGAQTGAIGAPAVIPVTGVLTMGGGGGAGVTAADFAGSAFTAISGSWISEQRPATPAAGSVDGPGGTQLWKPFFSFCGGGGSASNAGIGGNGGIGAYGSGGGGGGGGTTGGRGGDGGSGIVIIISW